MLQPWFALRKLTDTFNAADMRNICTEAGMFAIRAERDYVVEEDFMKAARYLALMCLNGLTFSFLLFLGQDQAGGIKPYQT